MGNEQDYVSDTSNLESRYTNALELKKRADTLEELNELIQLLRSLTPYHNTMALLKDAYAQLSLEQGYQRALWIRDHAETEEDFRALIKFLQPIRQYKDAERLLEEASQSAEAAANAEAAQAMRRTISRILTVAFIAAALFGGYKLHQYRKQLAMEEAARIAAEKALAARQSAMTAFFEGRNQDAVKELMELNSATEMPVFLNMLAMLEKMDKGIVPNMDASTLGSRAAALRQSLPPNNISYFSAEAMSLAERYANEGSINAKLFLGDTYHYGWDMGRDLKKALDYYSGPAESGDIYAQISMASVYLAMDDEDEAVKWTSKAAEQGNAEAQYNLGQMYQEGRGVKQDFGQAGEWYQKASEQGNNNAREALQIIDPIIKAFQAADRGDSDAQYGLSQRYQVGGGVRQDNTRAIYWLRKAAENGNISAQIELGQKYEDGTAVDQDYQLAMQWYRKAAAQTVQESSKAVPEARRKTARMTAQYRIGKLYEDGRGVAQDIQQAAEWYKRAADQGYAKAQGALGWIYTLNDMSPNGLKNDDNTALQLFRKGTEHNDVLSKAGLGMSFLLEDNLQQAKKYIQEAFTQDSGNLRIQTVKSLLALMEVSSMQNLEQALIQLHGIASQGDALAQMTLGLICENFIHSKRDLNSSEPKLDFLKDEQQAAVWYRQAAAQGYKSAKEMLEKFNAGRTGTSGGPARGGNSDSSTTNIFLPKNPNNPSDQNKQPDQDRQQNARTAQRSTRGNKLNLRSSPSTDSDVILQLDEGSPVDVLNESKQADGSWLFVQLPNGQTGWISGRYVQNRIGERGTHGGKWKSISGDDVNLRSGPGRNYSSVMKLNDGNLVEVISQSVQKKETWYQVYTIDERLGWVLGKYLRDRNTF